MRGGRYRARWIAGVDRAAAVHSAEVELSGGGVVALDRIPIAPTLPVPETVPLELASYRPATSNAPLTPIAEMDLKHDPALLPQMHRELQARGEADRGGQRKIVAE